MSDAAVQVEVRVVDEDGLPVGAAGVWIPVEGVRHQVDPETGRWSVSVLYGDDGTETVLSRGDVLSFEIHAPGFRLAEVNHVVGRGRHDVVTVTLSRRELVVPDGPPPAIDTLLALQRWSSVAERWVASGGATEDTHAWVQAREAVAYEAERWLEWVDSEGGDRSEARELCRIASRHPSRCG